MQVNCVYLLLSLFVCVWSAEIQYLKYEKFVLDLISSEEIRIVFIYHSGDNDDRTNFIFSELLEDSVVEEFSNYDIRVFAVDCEHQDCEIICKSDKICMYRKDIKIHELNFEDIEKQTFFSHVLLNVLENKVPRTDSIANPLNLDLYRGKEDVYLLFFPMNSNIDKDLIGKIAYRCQDLSNIQYMIDPMYFEQLFEIPAEDIVLVYLQCKHLNCTSVHLNDHLSLANIDRFLLDIQEEFVLREKESINEVLGRPYSRQHLIMLFYDWTNDHQMSLADDMIAYVSSYRHKFTVLVQRSSDFVDKMNYTFPLAKIINNDKTQGYIIQGSDKLTVDSLSYYMDIVEPPITPVFNFNKHGYTDLFSKSASTLSLDLSNLTRVYEMDELVHESFVLLYYATDAMSILVMDKYRKFQQEGIRFTYVDCFDDFKICEHLAFVPNATYPMLVYYENKFIITFNDVWANDTMTNFVKSMNTVKLPTNKITHGDGRVHIILRGKKRQQILFPGIETCVDVFLNNSSEHIPMQNIIASDKSRMVIQHRQEISVCLPQDIACIRAIYLQENMVEFNIKSMAHLYSKGVPLLVYFTEHRLQDSEIDQLSVQFQNKDYPSVWIDTTTSLGLFLKQFYFRRTSNFYKLSIVNKSLGAIYNYPAVKFNEKIFKKWIENIDSAIPSKSLTKAKWNVYGKTYSNQKEIDDKNNINKDTNHMEEDNKEMYDSDEITEDELTYEDQQNQMANSKCASSIDEDDSNNEPIVLTPSYDNYNPDYYKDEL